MRVECLRQRREGSSPVGRSVPIPEAPPRPAHVPVGHVVDETGEPSSRGRRVEGLQRRRGLPHDQVQLAEQPPVERRPRGWRVVTTAGTLAAGPRTHGARRGPCRRRIRRIGVQDQERGRIPVGKKHLPDDFLEDPRPDLPGRPRRARHSEEPAHGVRAVGLHQLHRLEHVAEVLAHLPAALIDQQAETDRILIGGLAEYQRADGHQRVEPAAGLVDGLADELRRVRPGRNPRRSAMARRTGRKASPRSRTTRR